MVLRLPTISLILPSFISSLYDVHFAIGLFIVYLYFAFQKASCKQLLYRSLVLKHAIVDDTFIGFIAFCLSISIYLSFSISAIELFLIICGSLALSIGLLIYTENTIQNCVSSSIPQLKCNNKITLFIIRALHSAEQMLKSGEERMQLWKALSSHQKTCEIAQCECKILEQQLKEMCRNFYKTEKQYTSEHESLLQKDIMTKRLTNAFLKDILKSYGERVEIRLLASYVEDRKLDNYIRAYFQIMKAEESSVNLSQELSIVIHREALERGLASKNENQGLEVTGLWCFEKMYQELRFHLEVIAHKCIDFWTELLQETINVERLYKKSIKISELFLKISSSVSDMLKIFPDHIKLLREYSKFLSKLMNNEIESAEYSERATNIMKVSSLIRGDVNHENNKYGYNSDSVSVTVSGNLCNLGIILNINDRISKFGYTKKEIIGKNISILLPPYIGIQHDNFIKSYFETGVASFLDHEKVLFILHKQGYIVPVQILIKSIPNLKEGLYFIGFIKILSKRSEFYRPPHKIKNKKYLIIITDDEGHVLGYSKKCFPTLGLVESLVKNRNFSINNTEFSIKNMNSIFFSKKIEIQMMNEGIKTTIRTECLIKSVELEQLSKEEAMVMSETSGTYKVFVQLQKSVFTKFSFRIYKIAVLARIKANQISSALLVVNMDERKQLKEAQVNKKNRNRKMNTEEIDLIIDNLDSSTFQGSTSTNMSIFSKSMKDFKKKIYTDTTPKVIIWINRTMLILLFFLIGSAIFDLIVRIMYSNKFKKEIKAISISNNRRFVLADIGVKIRSIVNIQAGLEKDSIHNVSRLSSLVSGVRTNIQELQRIELDLKDSDFETTEYFKRLTNTRIVTMISLDSFCNTESVSVTMNTAICQVVFYTNKILNHNASLENDPLPMLSFMKDTCATSTLIGRAIYFSFENLFRSLQSYAYRIGKEYVTSALINADKDEKNLFIIILCIGVSLVLCSSIIIPIIVKAEKSKVSALSIYSQLPIKNVKQMLSTCNEYVKKQLLVDSSDLSFAEDIATEDETPNLLLNNDEEIEKNKEQIPLLENPTPIEISVIGQKKAFKKIKTNIFGILLSFILIVLIFLGYLVLCYYLTTELFKESRLAFEQTQLITGRSPILVSGLMALRELFIRGQPYNRGVGDSLNSYLNLLKTREASIQEVKVHPSSALKKTINFFKRLDSSEMCSLITTTAADCEDCLTINKRILQNGMKNAIFALINFMTDSRQEFENANLTEEYCREILNRNEQVYPLFLKEKYINSALWKLQERIYSDSRDYYENAKLIDIIKCSCFILGIIMIICVIWSSFISNLKTEIFRARGILNLIPTDFILNDVSIKKEILKIISF